MSVRANISSGYLGRLALLAAVGFGFGAWSLFDGLVTYPKHNEQVLIYNELKKNGEVEKWEAMAKEKGWREADPKLHKPADITTQFVMATIASTVGLFFLVVFLRNRGTWIDADDEGLTTSWGNKTAFANIETLDKRKWRKKGIAIVRYRENGSKRKIALDDCNYEREPTEVILRAVEGQLSDEQITGGRRERPPADESEEEVDEDAAGANGDDGDGEETAADESVEKSAEE